MFGQKTALKRGKVGTCKANLRYEWGHLFKNTHMLHYVEKYEWVVKEIVYLIWIDSA